MRNKNALKFIRSNLYSLKRAYGFPITIIHETSESVNLQTGKKTVTKTAIDIKRGIVFPTADAQFFNHNIGFLRANANFTYGGVLDGSLRSFIIDRSDMPNGTKIYLEDYIIYHHKRYDVKKIESSELDAAYLISAKELEGETVAAIISKKLHQKLNFSDQIS